MKDFLLISLLSALACAKVMLQGFYSKKNVKTLADGMFFNGFIFFFAAVIFSKYIFQANVATALFGATFGLLTVFFQLFYVKAMSVGNVSLTVMSVNLGMIFPVLVSVFMYGEGLTFLKIFGFALTIVALITAADKNDNSKKKQTKAWFLFAIMACVSNGALGVCQKIFGNTEYKAQSQGFVAWAYFIAFAISLILVLILKLKTETVSFKLSKLVIGCSLGAGVILGVFQWLNTYAVSVISGVVLFPTYNGLSLVFSTFSGVFLLKEKLSTKQKISICIGVVAIVLLNI